MSARSFRYAAAFGLVLNLAFFAVLVTECFGDFATTAIDDVLTAAVPVIAGLACLHRDRRRLARSSRGWLYLGLTCLCWGAGGTAWTYYEVWQRQDVPFPSIADVGYLLAVPFAVLALIGLCGLRATFTGGVRAFMDAALVAGALLFVSWAMVLQTAFREASGPLLDRSIGVAYPISDVTIAAIALFAMAQVRGERRIGLALIGSGLLAVGFSDSAFALFTTRGDYATSRDLDVGYVIGYALIALAALRPERSTEWADESTRRLGSFLPYLPLVSAGAVTVVLHVRGTALSPFLFWDGIFLITLVLVRQLLGLYANQALSDELQASLVAVQEREQALHHQAFHDSLTALPNRAMFAERVNEALTTHKTRSVIVMLLDLDGFKQVNDTLGHPAGDRLLVIVADRLRLSVRSEDLVARLGGDEFGLLLAGRATLEEATGVARRVLATLREPADLGDDVVRIQGSIGVVEAQLGDGFDDILRHADLAMYRAKRAGKDTFAVHRLETV